MSLKKTLAASLAALLMLIAVPGASAADAPVLKRIVESGKLRVGMSGDQAPLNMKDRNGEMMGLEVDLAMLLAGAFEAELEMVQKPFPQLLSALEAGQVDIVLSGMSITPKRTMSASFVGPYVLSGKSILTKSNLLANADQAEDINESSIKLVALANSTSESFVKRNIPEATLTTVENYDAAVKMVLEDKADAMVADMPVCLLTVMRYPQDGLVTLSQPLSIEPIGAAISANDPQFKNLMETYMDAIEGTGILEVLRQKWFESGSWVAALP